MGPIIKDVMRVNLLHISLIQILIGQSIFVEKLYFWTRRKGIIANSNDKVKKSTNPYLAFLSFAIFNNEKDCIFNFLLHCTSGWSIYVQEFLCFLPITLYVCMHLITKLMDVLERVIRLGSSTATDACNQNRCLLHKGPFTYDIWFLGR